MSRLLDWVFEPRVFFVFIVLFVVGIVALALLEGREWETFAKTHSCKLVRTTNGLSVPTVGADGGVHLSYVPGSSCYLCDDGVEYCR